ncbi:MAG TPA: glycogen-binding domain-containing protein [Elusimicrobiales bacterium]|nr:glycogen-binding domain-containing protein [Elusimicrobiales bacterium]
MSKKRKLIGVLIIITFLFLLIAACFLFWKNFKSYFGFLDMWSNAKSELVTTKPHKISKNKYLNSEIEIKLIPFVLENKTAQEVYLLGNFTDWQKNKLKKVSEGKWQMYTALTKGSYLYYFEVDGEKFLDASNPETKKVDNVEYSLLVIK